MRVFVKDIKVEILGPSDELNLKQKLKTVAYGDFDLKTKGNVYIDGLKQKELRKILTLLIDNRGVVKSLVLRLRKDVSPIQAITKKRFKQIEAAGGIVEKGEKALYIHRLGRWDLPKGKLDKGETTEAAALREIYEECNVKSVIKQHLMDTYHIHKYKTGYVLKKTYWYLMDVKGNPVLKPQLEEDIDEVCWFSKNEAKLLVYEDTYNSLKELMILYFSMK